MDNKLVIPQGSFELQRLPQRKNELLRAWDAADEYILHYLAENALPLANSRILIINDNFGALATALHTASPYTMSDSWLSQQATRLNYQRNNIPVKNLNLLTSLDTPTEIFDLVLIKAPKTLALLEDELIRIRHCITSATTIIAAGMIKGLSPSVWKLFERIIGATTTSRAQKKARLIFVTVDTKLAVPVSPYPTQYQLENTDLLIINHANVFSRDKLDTGTRFFLQHIPEKSDATDIIDLGCGNGVVGIAAARKNPDATIYFVDESFMAIASARTNYYNASLQNNHAEFIASDSLSEFTADACDLVLCNPPFHQQHTVGDQIAINMFKQSEKVLREQGELLVIGNRHLRYDLALKKIFGNVDCVASNSKFVIFSAIAR
ncbi:MAG: methyltransferase [Gammaproteobacteria bacterium]|nr:methyltransferase [Gammaproteobacteria bacterium]